ncbi:hypothetical protein [Marilutibacter alkalisoli]|uniref:Tip attachment protein J domain-containing protein n=1 Tax=Marilutibacter alkalisoli TaxID=2591633 RepID=A0A514BTY5_9GAMM|nr:hypothetical protein [Lysobacter alkalisoli]QDH70836.1 hypothetical protein FKV23_12655 [Lysobacter alkalisoli]
MGKGSKPTIGYWHKMGLYMGESTSNEALRAVKVGGELAWEGNLVGSGSININKPMLFGGEKKEGGIVGTLDVRQGEPTQMPHPYLQQQVPGPWPAGRGLCTTVFNGDVGAMNPYVKQWSKLWSRWTAGWTTPVFEPSLCKVGEGMNPAHIIYDAFTSTDQGMGLPTSMIDVPSFTAAAQTLFDEGFGLCLKWSRNTPAGNFIATVCEHIGGQWAEDTSVFPTKIKLQLFRADYDAGTLPLLDESNIVELESWEDGALDAGVNEITVVGHDALIGKDIAVTYQNLANVQAQGRVVADKRQFPGLWNRELCARVAARECAAASALIKRVRLIADKTMLGVLRGDVLAISWQRKGVVRMPVRVLEVDEGTFVDQRIRLTLTQDIAGMAATSYIAPVFSEWAPPDRTPYPLNPEAVYEATYRDLAGNMSAADLQQVAADGAYLVSVGARPLGTAQNYTLATRTGAGDFTEVATGDFTPHGELAVGIGKTTTAITLANHRDLSLVTVGSEAVIAGIEHCRVDAIDAGTGDMTLARGCVDTVPHVHGAGTLVWFPDLYHGADPTEYLVAETVDAKLLTRTSIGQLELSAAITRSLVMAGRQGLPYPPGRFKIDGLDYPASATGEFVVTWAHRDRRLQADQLVDTTAAGIGPEPTTRYALRLLNDATSAVLAEKLDIAGTTASVELDFTGNVRIELYDTSSVGDSLQRHVHVLAYTPDASPVTQITAATYNPDDDATVIDGGRI